MRRALRAPLLCLLGLLLAAPSAAQAGITVNDVQAAEGNGGATMTFTITRDAGWFSGDVRISYATADGSAVAPADYAATSGTLSFGGMLFGGTDTRQVTVAIAGDALNELAESFRLTISGPEVTDGEGTGTIVDDDPEPALTLVDAGPVGEGSGAARFTMRLSKPSGRDVSATFATANGSATAGQDYTARGGRLTIPAGSTSVNLDVPIMNDTLDEPSETFELRISAPVAATIADGSATATIVDDDEPPAPPPAPGGGGGPGTPVTPPPPTSPPTVGSSSGPPALPRLGLSSPRLQRPATMLLTIACPQGSGGCRGRVTIFSIPNRRSKVPALRKERRIGRATFTLADGQSRTLRLVLGRENRRLLQRVGRMDVRAYAVTESAGGKTGVRTVRGTLIARTLHSR